MNGNALVFRGAEWCSIKWEGCMAGMLFHASVPGSDLSPWARRLCRNGCHWQCHSGLGLDVFRTGTITVALTVGREPTTFSGKYAYVIHAAKIGTGLQTARTVTDIFEDVFD